MSPNKSEFKNGHIILKSASIKKTTKSIYSIFRKFLLISDKFVRNLSKIYQNLLHILINFWQIDSDKFIRLKKFRWLDPISYYIMIKLRNLFEKWPKLKKRKRKKYTCFLNRSQLYQNDWFLRHVQEQARVVHLNISKRKFSNYFHEKSETYTHPNLQRGLQKRKKTSWTCM